MNHGIVDVFAFQEALLMEAVFGIAILSMIWVGFRRWLQYKERMGRLIAEQTAASTAQYGAQMKSVEARLQAIERLLTDGRAQQVAPIDASSKSPLPTQS